MEKDKEKKTKGGKKDPEKKDQKAPEAETPATPAVVVVPDELPVPDQFKSKLTRAQVDIIKNTIAKGASDDELKMFLYVCERTKLDPFSKQIHLVPRWDSKQGKEVRTPIVGIDGLRSVAERTDNYAGNTDPIFDGETTIKYTEVTWKGKNKTEAEATMSVPTRATATVKKVVHGVICDFTATAEWSEYYPGDKGGIMWRKMPKNMLGKCAEAKALRKAFPMVMSGLYVAEEMHQAQVAAPADPNQASAAAFEKAKIGMQRLSSVEQAEEFKGKVADSDKYTATQKKELTKIIDDRIKELKKAPPKTEDEPEDPAMDALDEALGGTGE